LGNSANFYLNDINSWTTAKKLILKEETNFLQHYLITMNLPFLINYSIILLLIPLGFFVVIAIIHAMFPKNVSLSKVWVTIKLSLVGILLSILVQTMDVPPLLIPYLQEIQGLIILVCMGNVLAYLLVDLYLEFRMRGEVPSFLREILLMAVYLFVGATGLRVIFHINVSSILTATTVLTAALAFALQSSLANIVSGFHIQADGNFKRKTWVWIKDKDIYGEIVNVGFRKTTLKTLEQYLVSVPNSFLTQNIVQTIGRRGDVPTGINLKVLLPFLFPPERAMTVLFNTLLEEPGILRDPAPSIRIDWFMENGIQYNLRFYLEDYGTILMVRNRILMRVWYAVTREGYSFPFPHREVVVQKAKTPFQLSDQGIQWNLRQIEFLSCLTDDDLEALTKRAHLRVFGNSETVVQQGDGGNSLFINLCGELDVSVDGRKVGTLEGGDFFGEMSLLTGENRRATVKAVGEVWLIEITKLALDPIIHSNPAIAEELSVALERRMEKTREVQLTPIPTSDFDEPRKSILVKIKKFFSIP
jgi:small-conductance mechanosensitive channel